MLPCPSCAVLLSITSCFFFLFRLQVLHSALKFLGRTFGCLAFVLTCSCQQHLLYHAAVHLMRSSYDDSHPDCPFWFVDSRFLPTWVRRRQVQPRLD